MTACAGRSDDFKSSTSIFGHPPLYTGRSDVTHPSYVKRSSDRRFRIFFPLSHLGLFQSSSLDFYTPWLHSITKNRQGTLPQSKNLQTPRELASQGMGPVLTMLALLAC